MIEPRVIFQILIPVIVGGILLVLWYWSGKRKRFKKSLSSPYTESLNFLISGDKIKALNKLREVVKSDTDNIDAYLKLGDIYREYGKNQQALRVHQALLIRKGLTNFQKLNIRKSLVLDHRNLRGWDNAVNFSKEIIELERNNLWAREQILEIYKEMGDWDGAVDAAKAIQKHEKRRDDETLALYQVQQGLEQRKKGEEREARIRFKKALKTFKNCAAAYYFIGVSYLSEDRKKEAVEAWRNFVKADPAHAYLVFDDLEEVLYNLGNFDQSERIYKEILNLDGDNISAMSALSDLYERRGDTQEAIEILRKAVDKDSTSLRARAYLIQMLLGNKVNKEVKENLKILVRNTRQPRKFDCTVCGHHSEKPLWICPSCLSEKTFLD
ncbi:MAG: tetratricopeptide repeat protein [Candidatus Marinimicrobia bacterium]|nr:tetratricopeptide repeat protein [Candidatus Neomarinimicrobiota bacterium]